MLSTAHVSSMYAQIVNGVPKEQSHLVTDAESEQMWDTISGEVEQMKADNPDIVFSIPNEMPEPDDDTEGEPADEPEDGPPPADSEDEPADEPAAGGKPKKGVNPFPPKKK